MEIQGLSDAQNIHSQHGALHGTVSLSSQSAAGSRCRFICPENNAQRQLELHEPQRDNNNNTRSRTSQFHLLAENGSEAALLSVSKRQAADRTREPGSTPSVGLYNVNTVKENELNALLASYDSTQSTWKYGLESLNSTMQMALPLFEGEEKQPMQQRQLTLPVPGLRQQQREDGAFKQRPLASRVAAEPRSLSGTNRSTQEVYVVLNVVQEDGNSKTNKPGSDQTCEDGGEVNGKREECCKARLSGFMEVGYDSDNLVCESNDSLNCVDTQALRKSDNVFSLVNGNPSYLNAKQSVCRRIVEDVVLTNKYGDKICGQICTENDGGKLAGALSPQPRIDEGITLMSGSSLITETMETSDFISDAAGLQNEEDPVTASTSPPASETFSGTIMINNQSIIVTIENGVLTLAPPPEGHVHKEDDMVSLKEHLGMKDHEDIVLLNYDSGTKSIGKISTLAVSSASHQEEPRPGLSVSDSELALVDDCPLSELGTSLDSRSIIKQEAGELCAVTEADLVTPSPGVAVVGCDNEDPQSVPPVRSKKEILASFCCPEPGCSSTFDTRQKLKVHLLNHAEDPRPHQCPMEGCGWAFATSYKLKRHLQSHDKQRPHICQFEGCGRRFTTVYNLKAHVKVHEHDNSFICEICSERFRSAARLANHQRVHFEPERPHKCEFPGCEKTFITFSALFSHNRTHFRETGHFTCTFPGCDKTYDKACRLKIHLRSHTGERPFVCDSEGCAWSFTSMSKLLRHKRKHDDDRRFVCTEEGCGKSFTRAEHLKGHSITHLGTKPFQCLAEGCNAKFSARSSLYIHSKKHKQDSSTLRTRCPVANCSKHFSSRSSLKSHMLKHHHLSPDVLNQMETTPTLTPSSELISSNSTTVAGPGIAGGDQLTNVDLSSLFSAVPGGAAPTSGIGVGIPVGNSISNSTFTMDLSLVDSGILTIDPSSVGTTLCTSTSTTLAKTLDPLILAASADMGPHHGLEGTVGDVLPPQGTLNLDDVQTVTPEALGTLTALTMQGAGATVVPTLQHPLSSSNALSAETTATLAVAPVAELLASPSTVVEVGGQGGAGPLLSCVEVLGPPEGGKVLTQFVFSTHNSSFSPQKDPELNAVSPSSFLESGGSARTDYRAIQLVKKKKKQRGPSASYGSSASIQRKTKGAKLATPLTPSGARYGEGASTANGGLTLRDPVTGAQYVQIQLLQDDPASDGDLAFQLSSQPSSSHSQLTVDLPVNILQEPSVMAEDDNGSDNTQFTGSTINLQDLE
ncbi:zinc finger protein ZXDC-like [Solea senegalensis]|uniref:Zinc finger protein ZXDC-like n=1 Tax=Solea senegalensis TaxID=28829 RepID=A0AAV6QQC3_SOLSE|nr:zinc finger protein ZXDC [Solea senegalensis]KAG7494326.1 zinc finger protein ZXDC-like [Solea senegalensis]